MKRVLTWLPIASIQVDRKPMGLSVFKLACHLARGRTVPPIHVVQAEKGRFTIRDGRHRMQAHKLLGREYILARYAKEDSRETK